jgi:hypothetical protein
VTNHRDRLEPLVKVLGRGVTDPITYILRKIFDYIKPDIVYLFSDQEPEAFSEIFDRVVNPTDV